MNIDLFYSGYIFISFISVNILILINEIKDENIRFSCAFLIVIFLSLFFGVRGENVGVDTMNYYDYFRNGDDSYQIREPLFKIFRKIDEILFWEYYSIGLILVSLSINLLFFFAFRAISRSYPGIFALFVTSFLYINININIVRQGLAMALIAYAIIFSLKKLKGAIFLYAISSVTHYSAVIIWIISLFFNYWMNRLSLKIFFVVVFLILGYFLELRDVLAPFVDYSSAISNAYWVLTWDVSREWNFKHIYYLIVALVVVALFIEGAKESKNMKLNNEIIFLLSFGFLCALVFKSEEMFVDRVFYYFIFLIPVIVYNIKNTISCNYLLMPFILIGANIWLIKTLFFQFPGWFIPPYDSIN